MRYAKPKDGACVFYSTILTVQLNPKQKWEVCRNRDILYVCWKIITLKMTQMEFDRFFEYLEEE